MPTCSQASFVPATFCAKPFRNGSMMVVMKAMAMILMARLNIAPMALSERKLNFEVIMNGRSGMTSMAMV